MNNFETVNPATEEKLSSYQFMSDDKIISKINVLEKSFIVWKNKSLDERIEYLEILKNTLSKYQIQLALLITETMGKPLLESKLEVEKCISQLNYYLQNGPRMIQQYKLNAHYSEVHINFQPLGVVFAIMPWNYPVWQFFRFAVGAWLSGNVVLLKHSEITTAVGVFLESLVAEVPGEPILQTIILDSRRSEIIFAHKSIGAVTFTGSTQVGRTIAQLAGKNLKKCVLELGGNDAFVVDSTADIAQAAQLAVKGRLTNNGQSCISSKRFFISPASSEMFLAAIEKELQTYFPGNPLEKGTRLGPLAHKKFYDEYFGNLEFLKSVGSGVHGAEINDLEKGYFVKPWFFLIDKKNLSVPKTSLFFQQHEVFSPIGMVTTYDSDEDLWRLVNESPYGLGAVWCGDIEKFKNKKLHLKFNVGMVAVNDILKSDPRVPFGGVKDSGYGRESGEFGIREFCNVQSLGIK